MYADVFGGYPLLFSSSNQPGWVPQILPYIEQANLLTQYNWRQPWFDASNAPIVTQRIAILECPTSPLEHSYTATDPGFAGQIANPLTTFTTASTDYFAIASASTATTAKAPSTIPAGYFYVYPTVPTSTDVSGAFGPQSSTPTLWRLAQITDGLSNTAMVSEMSGRPYLYVAGGKKVASANFPSYVSASSVDAADDIPLDYGWGGWAHNNNFGVGTWSADGMLQGGPGRQLQQLSWRVQFSHGRRLCFVRGRFRASAGAANQPDRVLCPYHGSRRRCGAGWRQRELARLY